MAPLRLRTYVAAVLLLALARGAQAQQEMELSEACGGAIYAHSFTLDVLGQLERLDAANTLDEGEPPAFNVSAEFLALVGTARAAVSAENYLDFLNLIFPFKAELGGYPYDRWANRRIQRLLSDSVLAPTANVGEVMVAVRNLTMGLAELGKDGPLLDSPATGQLWQDTWFALADQVLALEEADAAALGRDDLSYRSALLRSFNYAIAGSFPLPTSTDGLERLLLATQHFEEALSFFPAHNMHIFNASFSNGTADADLRVLFSTASPGTPQPTLVIWTPLQQTMETSYLRYGLSANRRGWSVLVFEAPGHGLTVRMPPHMPYVNNHSAVVEAVLAAAMQQATVGESINENQLVLMGVETAGYEAGSACVDMGSRLAGCILNAPLLSLAAARRTRLSQWLYGPFQAVAESNPETLPDPALAYLFSDPINNIYYPLLQECPRDSMAPFLFNALFHGGGIHPESLYSIIATLGTQEADISKLVELAWDAWGLMEATDAPWDPADISVPVLFATGEEDTEFIVHNVTQLFEQLPPSVRELSSNVFFEDSSGAALPGQRGAVPVWDAAVFPWLNSLLSDDE